MHKLIIKNLSKSYQLDKNKYFHALTDINLKFDDTGLVCIVGKSGSGKSTLLNMIARLDAPTKGEIYLSGKPYSKDKKNLYKFYQNDIGIVFQNYQLIDNKTALYNVALPLLVSGYRKSKALALAKDALRYVNLRQEIHSLPASKLSGGEKQRVAIARAIIKNPSIVLCDEPTGALDSKNSVVVMELLKKISKERLVIVVSHNLQLVENYHDRIIELSDGKMVNDSIKSKPIPSKKEKLKTYRLKSNWTSAFSLSNFKKRIKRNLFVILSLSISLIMANLVFGFVYGKNDAIKTATYRQLDFGSGSIYKEEMVSNTGILKLSKSVRPDLDELSNNQKINNLFEICPNFSSILPQNINISYDDLVLENINYIPLYSFDQSYMDSSLLKKGYIPYEDSLNEVVVNTKCYNNIKNLIHIDPLFEYFNLSHHFECNYVTEDGVYINDIFGFNITCRIVGVCDELSYLSNNKMFYSYLALENYMQEYVLNNLSTYFDNNITWYDRVMNAENYSYISGYSYLLFLKNYKDRTKLFSSNLIPSDYSFSSNSLVISNSLISFLQVAEYALFLFLGITLIGAVLILSIISFTNYCEDRKVSAILTSIGARGSDIEDIYLNESLLSGILSLGISLVASYPLSLLVNNIISRYISISNIIKIPYLKFFNVPLLYPLGLLIVVFLIIAIATLIPIKFSKNNSIRMELQAND